MNSADDEIRSARSFHQTEPAKAGQQGESQVAKETFLKNLHHNLQTPISIILGYTDILIDEVRTEALIEFLPQLEQIKVLGEELVTLVTLRLNTSRQLSATQEIDLKECISDLYQEVRTSLLTVSSISEQLLEQAEGQKLRVLVPDLMNVHSAAEHMLHFFKQVSRLSRLETSHLSVVTPASLSEAVRAMREAIKHQDFPASVTRGTILVVDDNELNCDVLARRLVRQGYRAETVQSGVDALKILGEKEFDLVLLDILMPEMDGFQVLKRLKADQRMRYIPVIMISALTEIESVARCIEMGAEDYLPKPFNSMLMRARIDACLEKKRLHDQELQYLQLVSKLTNAAAAVESGTFHPSQLEEVTAHPGELGRLARVFTQMAREIAARETMLEAKIQERTLELARLVERLNLTVDQLQLSERKALEASRAKSVFLANMSHELRTPLNAIIGFVQMLQRKEPRDADDREHLGIIRRSSEHLLGIINDVLSISKIEAGKVTLTETVFKLPRLLKTLEDMFRIRAQAKRLVINFELSKDLPRYVYGDEGKLRQILINLLNNAVKFTAYGGITLRAQWLADKLQCEVTDTGLGMSPDEIQTLFEPFTQTESGVKSAEGTGLGLTITRNYINLMNGNIRIQSSSGRGTTVTFEVTLVPASKDKFYQEARRVVCLGDNQMVPKMLVVDDQNDSRLLLKEILTPIGFEVREARNGLEAVEAYKTWHPDVIWMDVRMPESDGYEATRAIRCLELTNSSSSLPRTAIIAISAGVFDTDREAILAAGCDAFLAKPFHEIELFELLEQYLGLEFIYEEDVSYSPDLFGIINSDPMPIQAESPMLPDTWIDRMNNALDEGDIERAMSLLELIKSENEQLVARLKLLLSSYKVEEIQDFLKEIKQQKG
ncbi:MAG TPA: response regulator, partial [Acidobacteriota bacterium]|nr:response regulator [Acidobacteriota bacterium]HNH84171.1 response regulator [Acidobacteriota bacterium]